MAENYEYSRTLLTILDHVAVMPRLTMLNFASHQLSCSGRQGADLQDLARSLEVEIDFLGYCPRDELPKHLAQMSVFVNPSMLETFGMVNVEAMSMGIPIVVLAADNGSTDYLNVEKGSENAIVVQDSLQISDAVIALLRNPAEAVQIGARGRATVRAMFSLENAVERYATMYRALSSYGQLQRI